MDEYTPPPIITNDGADLLGAIPAIVGIVPADAFIAMVLADDGTLVMTLRVALDQPVSTPDPVAALANGLGTSLVLVVVNPRPSRGRHQLVRSFREQLTVGLKAVYWLPSMWEGAVYTEELSGDTGTMPDYRMSRHTLAMTLQGRVVFQSEQELRLLYDPADTHPPSEHPGWFSADDCLGAFEEAIRKERPMDAASAGALLTLEPYWDLVLDAIEINPVSAHDVLAAASRHLLGPERIEVLAAASYAAMRAGEGLLAGDRVASRGRNRSAHRPRVRISARPKGPAGLPPRHSPFTDPRSHRGRRGSMNGVITRLFVYGTLMPDAVNWGVLARWSIGTPAPDSIEGQLYATRFGYPAALVGAAGAIPGFVVSLDSARLDQALGALDDFEDVGRGLYKRVGVVTAVRVHAWAYHWLGSVDGMERIAAWRA